MFFSMYFMLTKNILAELSSISAHKKKTHFCRTANHLYLRMATWRGEAETEIMYNNFIDFDIIFSRLKLAMVWLV